jgi:hypothetical protein
MARSAATLRRRLGKLAGIAVPGTLVESYLRCGTPSCGCHQDPARRHGPHLYLKFRSPEGRSTGLYVPQAAAREARRAVAAWGQLWETLVVLGARNREALRERIGRRRRDAATRR